jgi:transposase
MTHVSKAIDEVRRKEATRLHQEGKNPVLSNSRYLFLSNPENLTDKKTIELNKLLTMNLRTVKAYLLRRIPDFLGTDAFLFCWFLFGQIVHICLAQ